jgi:hypothetical protein
MMESEQFVVPFKHCLFDRPVPEIFAKVVIDQLEDVPRGARVRVAIDDSGVAFFSGLMRATVVGEKERDNYAFLHSKELASRPSTLYSMSDLSNDVCDKGMAVLMNQGGYFAGAVFRESPMRAVLHKGHRRYITRKGQGHRQVTREKVFFCCLFSGS